MWVSNVCGLLRLNTTRVRDPAWTTLRLRKAGSPMSCADLPRPLPVSRKSSAIRGGLAMVKPAGGLARGAFRVNLITVRPDVPLDTLRLSMLLSVCARAGVAPNATIAAPASSAAQTRQRRGRDPLDGKGLIVFAPVVDPLPLVVMCSTAQSSLPCRPG